jgi:SAM-dependent methyltransferase
VTAERQGLADAVVWHDVECGSYSADLPLWRELARRAGGPVLELGAGTGRVALDLAERGHEITALDSDAPLLDELARRAAERGLGVARVHADARSLAPFGRFALVLAPMQLLQVVGGAAARAELLTGVAALLAPGGRFAAALAAVDEAVPPEDALPPLPDVLELDGWVYSSLPLDVRPEPDGVAVERVRQIVSPSGDFSEERHTQLLASLSPEELEREAAAAGLRAEARHEIAATHDHVGSTVVVLERPEDDRRYQNAGLDAPRR